VWRIGVLMSFAASDPDAQLRIGAFDKGMRDLGWMEGRNNLAHRLERDWSGVSSSILEGIEEILTVTRLGLPKELRRSLACTNIIENAMGTVRRVCRNVKRWRSASMAMLWTAAAMQEAAKGGPHKDSAAIRLYLTAVEFGAGGTINAVAMLFERLDAFFLARWKFGFESFEC
jgi:hypothetical protein